jgi:hypothetical protein
VETVNLFRTDSEKLAEEDASTKEDAIIRARELAMERNATVNVAVSKDLLEWMSYCNCRIYTLECADDTNIYVFWYLIPVEEQDEDELADENNEQDAVGQLSIKEDLSGSVGRS